MTTISPLKIALLTELAHAPRELPLVPHDALRSSVRWAVAPQPTYAEIDDAIADLDHDGMITCTRSELYGVRWAITDAGRVALRG